MKHDIYRENKKNYINSWKQVLVPILGWSEEDVNSWSVQWNEYLETGTGAFYHEPPSYYIADLLLAGCRKDIVDRRLYQQKWNNLVTFIDTIEEKCDHNYGKEDINYIYEYIMKL